MRYRVCFVLLVLWISIKLGATETRTYSWSFAGSEWTFELELNEESMRFYKSRSRLRDYDLYVTDTFDDKFINSIVKSLEKAAKESSIPRGQVPHFVISFVQHLPYTEDSVTAGFDEYPRFPYETLYDNGGDCEDTSILVSALLREMGYDVVLLKFNAHLAVGVKAILTEGSYFIQDNNRYYYLETTGDNWKLGSIPSEYIDEIPEIITIKPREDFDVVLKSEYTYNATVASVDVIAEMTNVGSKSSSNTKIYVYLLKKNGNLWSSKFDNLKSLEPEDKITYRFTDLYASSTEPFKIRLAVKRKSELITQIESDWITCTEPIPEILLDFSSSYRYNKFFSSVEVDVEINLENKGSLIAEGCYIIASLENPDSNILWDVERRVLGNINIGESRKITINALKAKTKLDVKIIVKLKGNNFDELKLASDWLILK